MVDKEKRAHDLAILYMQMEIKHGQIIPAYTDANSASTERVFRYQLNIDSDCF